MVLVRRLSADAGCSHPAVVNTDAVIAESPLSLLWGKSRRWGCGPPRFTRHQGPQGFRHLPVLRLYFLVAGGICLEGPVCQAPCWALRTQPEGAAGGGGRRGGQDEPP